MKQKALICYLYINIDAASTCFKQLLSCHVCVHQNVRLDRHAAANDGQGDWLDVQTLYTSPRYAEQRRTTQSVGREHVFCVCLSYPHVQDSYIAALDFS